ncbi:S-DNA-T family DNA segregation ATPase FtsK/SpoIIIE [Anaerotaenia torta]|uniref:FtsK/SpoIIIE family DNA translocase n=1 Tax=Anaerotaenia torta TaxID=433293 RepID=UPI003D1C0E1B
MASKQKSKKASGAQRRKSTGGKNNSTRNNRNNGKDIKESGAVQDEIILILALVVSILLFLSNFDLSGKAGKAVSGFIFGMIGWEAYLLPFILFFMTAFHISNLGNRRAGRKLLSASVFFVALAGVIELTAHEYSSETKFVEYYMNSMTGRNGGGMVGGILVMIFCSLFEKMATYVILIAVMLISVIVISGKAIFTYIAKNSKNSLAERKEYQRIRKEQREELDAVARANGQERRPPKTFLLDTENLNGKGKKGASGKGEEQKSEEKDTVIQLKDRKLKKGMEKELEKLPVINFHGLFEEAAEPDSAGAAAGEDALPTYEEELRNKFGRPVPEDAEITKQFAGTADTTPVVDIDAYREEHHNEQDDKAQDTGISNAYSEKDMLKEDSRNFDDEASRNGKSQASGHNGPEQGDLHQKETSTMGRSNTGTDKASTAVDDLGIDQLPQPKEYIFPPISLLAAPKAKSGKSGGNEAGLRETAMKLQSTLDSFGVHVAITNVSCGPAVTRYELQPEQGVKVSRITALADDIKLNLAAADIRIEAPIPGKAAVGIEVPNKENSMVAFRELIECKEFTGHSSDIAFGVGKDIGGQTVITDIAKMPHLLIAGATGSGKSVCINTLIMSILYKAKPSDVRLIMVDPKVVELSVYNGIPHLLIPVVTDPKKASAALNWAVMEMTERYKKFADAGVRDLKGYNEKAAEVAHLNDESCQKLPQIVIIIDELADLMMVAPGEVEDAICRLAQMARAAGLHLIIATQRPSVNVITGLIKANIPSRIAFAVSSAIDSRTILDGSGAEKLLGKGDMLFFPSGYPKPVRIQGAFVSDKEVSSVVEFLKKNNNEASYSDDVHDKINNAKPGEMAAAGGDERDEYFAEAGKFIIEKDKASIGMLQRVYKIGFNRAARIMDQLYEAGVVGAEEGTKPRKILMTQEEFEQYLEEY